MCGIAGSYCADLDVAAALTRIAHRGPDGDGIVEVGNATFGHVRLAIQDPLPRSGQPFRYESVILTFVGEVYNWREIRERLESVHGATFTTEGDTEVVAALLNYEGAIGLRRIEGPYAIAAWLNGNVLLARDALGRIPLYISNDGLFGTLWASERRAFPDPGAAEAFPAGIAHSLDWKTPLQVDHPKMWPAPLGRPLEDLILSAVDRRAVTSDVPICSLLSGGVDSSLVAAMLAKDRPDLITYCTTVDPDGPDLEAARLVADHIGVELREVIVPEPTLEDVRAAVAVVEVCIPSAIETALLQAPLAKRIYADGFRVAFSGECADEVWGGYGPMGRFATDDASWLAARMRWLEKMARADFIRANKSMMSGSVEVRCPLADRGVVGLGLALRLKDCPPGKKALRDVADGWLPKEVARRKKMSWHKGQGGLREHLEELTGGKRVKTYNSMVKERFGALVRG